MPLSASALPSLIHSDIVPTLTDDQRRRYARHLNLPGVGEDGQRRLASARVLVIGAGGLGSPVLLYLAAAGIGHIGVVDDDVVDDSNLQRQVIHGVSGVGTPKVESAAARMRTVNPDIEVTTFAERLSPEKFSAIAAAGPWDVVVDACDNFSTRYIIADLAEYLQVPEVMGAVFRWQGQVSTFWKQCPVEAGAVTLRDLYPTEPPSDAIAREPQAGIVGALCASIGGYMSTEVLKLVLGTGETLLGRVLFYDALSMTLREVSLRPNTPA